MNTLDPQPVAHSALAGPSAPPFPATPTYSSDSGSCGAGDRDRITLAPLSGAQREILAKYELKKDFASAPVSTVLRKLSPTRKSAHVDGGPAKRRLGGRMCAATAFALQLPLRSSEDLVGYGQAVCRGFEQIASDRITGTDSQKKLGRMTQFVREKAATMITPWVLSDAVHAKMLDELRGRVYEVSPSTVKRYRHRAFTDIVQTIVDNHRTEIDAAFAAHGPRLLTRHKTHLMGALALCGYRMTLSAPVDSVRYALAANALRHEVNSEIIASLESTHRIPHNESTEHLLD